MDLQQAKVLLEKINSLFKSIGVDERKIAAIERDLMLDYIRQLYEAFFSDNHAPKAAAAPTARPGAPELEIVENKPAPPPLQHAPEPEKVPQPEPPQRTYRPPRIIEIPDALREITPPKPGARETPSPKIAPPPPPPPLRPSTGDNRSELEELFEQKKATELSEKLGDSPVADLAKAMAINDRLLYMNELFGKDMGSLEETLQRLNQMSSFNEAKGLLAVLADRYQWTEKERLKIAKAFIKLVHRRYL
jgi:hypothetical protein